MQTQFRKIPEDPGNVEIVGDPLYQPPYLIRLGGGGSEVVLPYF